jgi:glycerol-1-phosphate dehydrogenase [NAD(P)+]
MTIIDDLISGQYQHGGQPAPDVLTRSVLIEPSLDGKEVDAIRGLKFPAPFAVVSDPDTHRVLGGRVEEAAAQLGQTIHVNLPAHPHADIETADMVAELTAGAGSIIAVGSGTINDLCKYAAAKNDLECAVFATAPSMNGYTSVNAAITVEGLKKSLTTVAPEGVFMDLQVLSEAPKRMIRSGLGDSVCRPMAQADWLMTDILKGSTYSELPFDLLITEEESLLAKAGALIDNDTQAMGVLARTLILSGMGMTICGGSYPASQGEHLISHYVEMRKPPGTPDSFHGEQIAVSTLVMARLQERVLAGDTPKIAPTMINETEILAHFGASVGTACWQEFSHKCLDEEGADRLNARLTQCWPEIVKRVSAVSVPSETIATALNDAGAPTSYADIGLERNFFCEAITYARTIRNRYTFLDLADDSGMLNAEDLI